MAVDDGSDGRRKRTGPARNARPAHYVEQAVIAIEQIAATSRSVVATAQGIALAASRQGDLAADLAMSVGERVSQRARREAEYGT